MAAYRHTKIVFTLGPASAEPDVLRDLIRNGVDVCRLNMAHGTHEWVRESVTRLRATCAEAGRDVAIMMDVKGPEVRTGDLPGVWELQRGETFDLFLEAGRFADGSDGNPRGVSVNYPGLVEDVHVGSTVLVDNGLVRFAVIERLADRIRCRVEIPGPIKSRRHINLPGVHVRLPALTAKDREDIALGVELGVDYFALSFVREADDIDQLRRLISTHRSPARIIAKIEDQSAITNLEEIIRNADALMVARGDLGIEVPFEELPLIQRRAVDTCLTLGKPVIIATHVLESMILSPLPTRAEITDVANAVHERADAIMLSGETTVGKYPRECVDVLRRVIGRIERGRTEPMNPLFKLKTPKAMMMRAAAGFAEDLGGAPILVFTRSGHLASALSSLRPRRAAIFAFTDNPTLYRQLLLHWGIEPFLMPFEDVPEQTIRNAFARLLERGWATREQSMVVITNVIAGERVFDTVQLRRVE